VLHKGTHTCTHKRTHTCTHARTHAHRFTFTCRHACTYTHTHIANAYTYAAHSACFLQALDACSELEVADLEGNCISDVDMVRGKTMHKGRAIAVQMWTWCVEKQCTKVGQLQFRCGLHIAQLHFRCGHGAWKNNALR